MTFCHLFYYPLNSLDNYLYTKDFNDPSKALLRLRNGGEINATIRVSYFFSVPNNRNHTLYLFSQLFISLFKKKRF